MPYGDLARERVQRFASRADLEAARCTIEEREEYEPWVAAGAVVFAGVDYAAILAEAESCADVIVWDGGNNDFPFLRPDLHLVLVDALRPGQLTTHHPGEAVLRMADVVVVTKTDGAPDAEVQRLVAAARAIRPSARVVRTASPPRLADPGLVRGRRVLVVEDGPSLTTAAGHGAAVVAASTPGGGARRPARPRGAGDRGGVRAASAHRPRAARDGLRRRAARGARAHDRGLGRRGRDLGHADRPRAPARLAKPVVRVRYELEEVGEPGLGAIVDAFVDERTPDESAV
jgi:predicted GTPase